MLYIIIKFICVLVVVCLVATILNTIDKKKFIRARFNNSIDNLVLITLFNDNKPFNFVLDTGSTYSILSKQFKHQIKHTNNSGNTTVYGVDGNPTKAESIKTNISFSKTSKREYSLELEVIEFPGLTNLKNTYGIEIVGLLGHDFCKRFKAKIDYSKNILKLKV